jgi:2-polyprenyl-3-methyl-5-hydroxy-6-metoxy-1,4-benzoquinol methylase
MLTFEKKKTYFDHYWKQQPADKVARRARERARLVSDLIGSRTGRLLDVGCGRGFILDFMARRGFHVTGADVAPAAVAMAGERGCKAVLFDLETEEMEGKYDVILCLEVLQQLADPVKALVKLRLLLADDGVLIISLPNEFHIISRLRILLGISHLGHFDHSHLHLFSPRRDRESFKRAGLAFDAESFVPVVPPQFSVMSKIFSPLARLWPSLFAISSIYRFRV